MIINVMKAGRPGVVARAVTAVFCLAFGPELSLGQTCSQKAPGDVDIVLDVGHTVTKPGATSARGIREYYFNLNLAPRIKDSLVRSGFRSTHVMLIDLDGTRGLRQRADRANNANSDIFLSIHHDGVADKYLTPWLYEGEEHYYFDRSKGFSLHISPNNGSYRDSLRLARTIADRLMAAGLDFTTIHEPSRPEGAKVPLIDPARGIYRRDNLVVLNETEMPAVLIEAGMIVNRDEELALSSPARQETTATAVAEAVSKFCSRDVASYRVTNVAPDDVLNIRSGPDADRSVVGTIPPGGRGVLIVGTCMGLWCQIDYRGVRGWANRRFLTSE
jgi:N-acetylmuramoyl-L-alanine amidase